MTALFDLAFWLAAPLWALMILAPGWSGTQRVMASPWVATLPLIVYFVVAFPHFAELWQAVSRPELSVLQEFLARPYGATLIWAQLIAFDLFIGRWMYFEGRHRGISPLVVSPILLLTIFVSPLGLVLFLLVRSGAMVRARQVQVDGSHP